MKPSAVCDDIDMMSLGSSNKTGNLLFNLPFVIDKESRADGRQENAAENSGGNLGISQTRVRVAATLVPVAARRLVQRRTFAHHPQNLVRQREFLHKHFRIKGYASHANHLHIVMYTYRRRVVGVIEPANGHHLVVSVKFVLVSHFVDVDGTRDVVEYSIEMFTVNKTSATYIVHNSKKQK
jgi:hypothetical protein